MWTRSNLLNRNFLYALCIVLLASTEFIQSLKYDYVTYSSVVKLLNVNSNVRLHSHDVKYGSGSGQQSVTAVKNSDDHNSAWQVLPVKIEDVERGEKVKCGSEIRLYHLSTRRNLHSHLFVSPLSHNQEVSAYGDNGVGDEGDNWILECDDDFWSRSEPVRFKHQATQKFLHVSGDMFGRPIQGQYEVSALSYRNAYNLWQVLEGVYIKPATPFYDNHDEL